VPPDGLIGVGLLILQAHTSVHKLPPPPPATYSSDNSNILTPSQTFSAQRQVARHPPSTIHGRLHVSRNLLQRRTTSITTNRIHARATRHPTQPQEGRLDAYPSRRPLRLNRRPQLRPFRAPHAKLNQTAQQASSLLGRAATNARWLRARELAAFAGKAQFLYLAIAPARLFSRERHDVLATRRGWGGRGRLTHQLRRDLEWCDRDPTQNNCRSIYKPIETAYLHADSSDYGWGAVLNDNPNFQARGFGDA
jgi:hypothetical protein